jgi:hypothetical protein
MSCGPVRASTRLPLPEVGGDVALRADPHGAIELSDAMYQVLTDANLRGLSASEA